jgi:hypothetical protein
MSTRSAMVEAIERSTTVKTARQKEVSAALVLSLLLLVPLHSLFAGENSSQAIEGAKGQRGHTYSGSPE